MIDGFAAGSPARGARMMWLAKGRVQVENPSSRAYAPVVVSQVTRILIVDDDAEIREYLELALDGPDCRVATCAAAAEVPERVDCDVALVDLLLDHGETGEPLISRLAQADVRVVVMTGLSSDAPPVRRALRAGASSVLQKPFTLSALRQELLLGA